MTTASPASPAGSATAAPLLSVQNVSKRYGEGENSVLALDDVSLDLEGGKIYGLLGPNGAGKTTLLRMCGTLLSPTSGDIWLARHHTVNDPRGVRENLGYLSASTGVYSRLTPTELMRYFGRLHHMTDKRIEERTELLFAVLGIGKYRHRMAGKLSTGMRQKVSIARAFLHDPPVLILDEPTNGLDVVVRNSLLDLLRDFAGPERLIVLSTHDLPEAESLCDAFIFIDGGKIVARGPKEEILPAGSNLHDAFFSALDTNDEAPHAP